MPQNTDCNIDNGTPPTMSCGKVELNYQDTLTLGIGSGFTNSSQWVISDVSFYNVVNEEKGPDFKGSWKRVGAHTMPDGVSGNATTQGVVLTDTDTGNVDEDYYYEVTATNTATRQTATADPELVIRKRTGP